MRTQLSRPTRLFVACSLCLLVVCGLAVAPAAATVGDASGEPSEAFQVTVGDDGDADILLQLTFDLTDDSEQAAFEELQADTAATERLRDRFESRMAGIADDSAAAADREMRAENATADLDRVDDTGVATLSVTWRNLAAVEDDQLVVTEPFVSGFQPSQRFVLVGPSEYAVASVTPTPDTQDRNTLMWRAETDLSGFNATFEADDSVSAEEVPGFGPVVAIAGLLGVALFARRHAR